MTTSENKLMRKRIWSAYISSVLSISLVLLFAGVGLLLLVNASNVSSYFKEHMKLSVVMTTQTTEQQAQNYMARLEKQPYAGNVEMVTREQGIREMEELLGTDFLSVFETSPIPVSLNLSLKAEYVDTEKIDSIKVQIEESPLVDSVVWQKSLVETLNSNLRTISLVLSVFVALLLVISYALINNTVRLNLYSKRFTIHTMRLVGATKGFIRRPFMIDGLFQGTIAALLAIILLLGGLIFVKQQFAQMFTVFQLRQLLGVIAIIVAAGILICEVTTFFVVGRMVSLKKEDLYF